MASSVPVAAGISPSRAVAVVATTAKARATQNKPRVPAIAHMVPASVRILRQALVSVLSGMGGWLIEFI